MSTTADHPTDTGAPRPRPARSGQNPLFVILKPIASLQLTVVLFALAMLLVFFGTLSQKTLGIWTVVDRSWSWIVMVDVQPMIEFGKIFFEFPADAKVADWVQIPLPGGKLLGGLMFINLLAAHTVRFKLTWKRAGIFILHAGFLLLFVGEYITREFQVEQQMHVTEGASMNYAFDTRNFELAVVTPGEAETEHVTVVPASLLRQAFARKTHVTHNDLPFDLEVVSYLVNSEVVESTDKRAQQAGPNPATAGIGLTSVAVEEKEVTGVDTSNKMDIPSAYVRFYKKGTDQQIGTYLLSAHFLKTQKLATDANTAVGVQLRFTRHYKPFSLHLIKFRFDRYIGTSTAKNYSSELRLIDPERGQDREVTISMNSPLRYRGETFFQSSFTPDEKTTILQVVRNPGWRIPYISCAMIAAGMIIHFGLGLIRFVLQTFRSIKGGVARVSETAGEVFRPIIQTSVVIKALPWVSLGMAVLYLVGSAAQTTPTGAINLGEAARLPVVDGGRVKPLDTVARVDMRIISSREEFVDTYGKTRPAIKWFFDSASGTPRDPGVAAKYEIFRIENDQVLDLLKLTPREGLRYSMSQIKDRSEDLQNAATKAAARPDKDRDLFETKVLELRRHIETYLKIWQGYEPMVLPPQDGREWRTAAAVRETEGERVFAELRAKMRDLNVPQNPDEWTEDQKRVLAEALEEAKAAVAKADPAAAAWQRVLGAYRTGDQSKFDAALAEFKAETRSGISDVDRARARFEVFLNETGLFYHCTALYILAIILCLASWVTLAFNISLANGFRRSAFLVLLFTLLVHAFTLFSRMYLMDRPLVFVTNLYSSAVFIGCAAVAVGLIVEVLVPISVGCYVAAVIGMATSIIAHNLAESGDTLEMMQAVLDTNFWLATHVTTVTFGYSATYFAGMIGLVYVILAAFPNNVLSTHLAGTTQGRSYAPSMTVGRVIGQILYGVICLATMLSFIGTVLGGIWADQSWGRFWGWDPKENGAVLIVIWNALILHARWCGLVKDRGVAVLALVGNMITTWSWFGTNQLGVGLHAYGFSNKLALGCTITWALHLFLFIPLGLMPWKWIWGQSIPVAKVRETV
ncbi:cytochrome c biogenesis protein [Fimbriiglobus ruber]|uniref:Putative cytochrome C-type biogenesis protein n=1 Tax=Fimbriiglobus ruber TaxID=1908690 RepID=A0A225DC28_9BACT|nr:cytochrome c biogenesis protein CcsA [Fimbriiglobus ruber]OWK34699.1 putative cytochrome C-type biogenesis protein [Fimbriiglobus ruber]